MPSSRQKLQLHSTAGCYHVRRQTQQYSQCGATYDDDGDDGYRCREDITSRRSPLQPPKQPQQIRTVSRLVVASTPSPTSTLTTPLGDGGASESLVIPYVAPPATSNVNSTTYRLNTLHRTNVLSHPPESNVDDLTFTQTGPL